MSTPSPSSSSSPPPSSSNPTASPPSRKPSPWIHQETVHLIQAYQEKWYSAKRGQLKASQWEEVAVTVTARCGYDDYSQAAKTATQCRHKMEKLRRRYREEKRRVAMGGTCNWLYYRLMDSMERGPLPISARPLAPAPRLDNYRNFGSCNYNVANNDAFGGEVANNYDDDDGGDNEEEEEKYEEREDYGYRSKSRSINYILRKPNVVNRFAGEDSSFFPREMLKRRKREEGIVEVEKEKDKWKKAKLGLGLAEEIRSFADRMMGMERKKIEMVKEVEMRKIEMENKRVDMILNFHKKIVDSITYGLGSPKELKMEQEV